MREDFLSDLNEEQIQFFHLIEKKFAEYKDIDLSSNVVRQSLKNEIFELIRTNWVNEKIEINEKIEKFTMECIDMILDKMLKVQILKRESDQYGR